jgi:hypothetical protein
MKEQQHHEELLFGRFFVQVFKTDDGVYRFKVSDDWRKNSIFAGSEHSFSSALATARRFAIGRNACPTHERGLI